MSDRNYPCDNVIAVYFGSGDDLNATGEAAFKRQLWRCMIGQALWIKSDIETRLTRKPTLAASVRGATSFEEALCWFHLFRGARSDVGVALAVALRLPSRRQRGVGSKRSAMARCGDAHLGWRLSGLSARAARKPVRRITPHLHRFMPRGSLWKWVLG